MGSDHTWTVTHSTIESIQINYGFLNEAQSTFSTSSWTSRQKLVWFKKHNASWKVADQFHTVFIDTDYSRQSKCSSIRLLWSNTNSRWKQIVDAFEAPGEDV
jgi:hypothetical protein